MSNAQNFVPFASWWSMLEHIDQGGIVYYRAPFDRSPVLVSVYRIPHTARLHVISSTIDCDPFVADLAHADRFFRRA